MGCFICYLWHMTTLWKQKLKKAKYSFWIQKGVENWIWSATLQSPLFILAIFYMPKGSLKIKILLLQVLSAFCTRFEVVSVFRFETLIILSLKISCFPFCKFEFDIRTRRHYQVDWNSSWGNCGGFQWRNVKRYGCARFSVHENLFNISKVPHWALVEHVAGSKVEVTITPEIHM